MFMYMRESIYTYKTSKNPAETPLMEEMVNFFDILMKTSFLASTGRKGGDGKERKRESGAK
jgi:hypothetical protein